MSFIAVAQQLGSGMLASLSIFVLTLVFSLPLGLLVAFGRKSRIKPVQWLVNLVHDNRMLAERAFYCLAQKGANFTNISASLQLLVVYFGPYYLFGIRISKEYSFYATIIGFSINYAAYFAEIYRAGIEGIPVGQYEAAKVLGYSKAQTFCKIIFPQMVKRVVPPVTNEVITLVKDTSMAFVLAYAEMFTIAKQIAARVSSIMPLFVAGLFYYIFNFVVAFIMERIEKKLSYYK